MYLYWCLFFSLFWFLTLHNFYLNKWYLSKYAIINVSIRISNGKTQSSFADRVSDWTEARILPHGESCGLKKDIVLPPRFNPLNFGTRGKAMLLRQHRLWADQKGKKHPWSGITTERRLALVHDHSTRSQKETGGLMVPLATRESSSSRWNQAFTNAIIA